METLDYDYTVHSSAAAAAEADASLLVKFYIDTVHDQQASEKEGRPIYKDVEFIDIRIPGNKDNVVIRPAREVDKQRFSRHYAAFKARTERGQKNANELVGTPLALWPVLKPSQVKEFEFFNILTVEQLASASDSVGQKFMGFQDIRRKAQGFAAAANAAQPVNKLQKALEDANARIAALEAQLENSTKAKRER